MEPITGSVSWTCNPVKYYLHVIDRTKVNSNLSLFLNYVEEIAKFFNISKFSACQISNIMPLIS